VLIADLNVGQPGDGFTVVSAMRRTQPDCVTFILTGYPAFETALEAIRSQVDDYLVKPANIKNLVSSIENKLKDRKPRQTLPPKRIASLLRENIEETSKVLESMKADPQLDQLRLSDNQRVDDVPKMIGAIADSLESNHGKISENSLRAAADHGKLRRKQGYSIPMMVEDTHAVDGAVHEIVQNNLLFLDVSHLISDLRAVNGILEMQLKESLKAYTSKQGEAA
jgi:YesN/AraC family two-component response regulator